MGSFFLEALKIPGSWGDLHFIQSPTEQQSTRKNLTVLSLEGSHPKQTYQLLTCGQGNGTAHSSFNIHGEIVHLPC